MRRAKLLVMMVFVLSISMMALTPAQGQSKKTGGAKGGANGAKIFDDQCATCHDKGENTIEADKTLKMDALKANGFNGVADIKARVMEGKGIMPAFKEQLKPAEIDAVADYVWAQAQKGWK